METFTLKGNEILLTILDKKSKANFVANELSKLLFIVVGGIVEASVFISKTFSRGFLNLKGPNLTGERFKEPLQPSYPASP